MLKVLGGGGFDTPVFWVDVLHSTRLYPVLLFLGLIQYFRMVRFLG